MSLRSILFRVGAEDMGRTKRVARGFGCLLFIVLLAWPGSSVADAEEQQPSAVVPRPKSANERVRPDRALERPLEPAPVPAPLAPSPPEITVQTLVDPPLGFTG